MLGARYIAFGPFRHYPRAHVGLMAILVAYASIFVVGTMCGLIAFTLSLNIFGFFSSLSKKDPWYALFRMGKTKYFCSY